MNDDQLKSELAHYVVAEPRAEDISQTIQIGRHLVKKRVKAQSSLLLLLRVQLTYLTPLVWVPQLLVILMTLWLTANLHPAIFEVHRTVNVLIPLVSLFSVQELMVSQLSGMSELEASFKHHYAQVFISRLLLIGLLNVTALLALLVFLSHYYAMPLTQLLQMGMIPFNLLTGLNLLLIHYLKLRSRFAITALSLFLVIVWASASLFRSTEQYIRLDNHWLFIFSLIFLLLGLYHLLTSIRTITFEEDLRWN